MKYQNDIKMKFWEADWMNIFMEVLSWSAPFVPTVITVIFGLFIYKKQKAIELKNDTKLAKINDELTKNRTLVKILYEGKLDHQKLINAKRHEAIDKLWFSLPPLDALALKSGELSRLYLDDIFDSFKDKKHIGRSKFIDLFKSMGGSKF